jgi:hypothetical protein
VTEFAKLSRREKDDRLRRSSQKQIASRKEMLVADGMAPADAERKASRMQEKASNMAREMIDR